MNKELERQNGGGVINPQPKSNVCPRCGSPLQRPPEGEPVFCDICNWWENADEDDES